MGVSIWHLILVLVVIVALFGTGKLTRAIGDLARGVRTFRDEMKDLPVESPRAEPATPKALPAPGGSNDQQPARS